ncbi:MAG TPA: class I SAM-dependent methyltransferase [Clostridia bacterium]|nr:class I SAM-dependent methyltransferase [Clostridia bacterium]HOM34787.1 class I SAM-dependent methyltransferase [Clostridia bacterium]HOT70909.1 class I SAM-dependent methyltransferase [Clostridia bacterium]HQF99614.1 class I SAM-dependent methyltransferase [Clostridia bacterium]HQH64592.1 class I SAM-dependent methyltransferase [Clostridia bacterium]
MMYDCIADVYDILMKDVNYAAYADYIDEIIARYQTKKSEIILDVGCGTGSLTCALRDKGYSMIGTDPSQNMLNIALSKDTSNIQYINQSMENLDLFGTVQTAVSLLDCINHITDRKRLQKAFDRVSLFLESEGLFIFDLNTVYKFETVLAKNTYFDLSADVSYTWMNKYNKKTGLCRMEITYFIKNQQGCYKRYDTCNIERAYSDKEIIDMANRSGFELADMLDDLSFDKPKKNSTRKFIILKKK